jgi:3'(2'), 5'-bisphosphate nucleotidase
MLKEIKEILPELIGIAEKAASEILQVYEKDFSVDYKDDRSPLTEADRRSHGIIMEGLKKITPHIPVLSEEGADIEYSERSRWQDFWLVDPLDGTKEFIKRNGEFTINIALIRKQRPVFGLISIPVSSVIYYGGPLLEGVYKYRLDENSNEKNFLTARYRIKSEDVRNGKGLTVVGSRSHGSDKLNDFVERLKSRFKNIDFLSAGSALKFCLVAEGKADIYPRFGPTMEWDTASGLAILLASDAIVLRVDKLTELTYNKQSLRNPDFIVIRKHLSEEIIPFLQA